MKTKTIILMISVVLVGIFIATIHPTTSQAAPTADEVVGDGTPGSCTEEEFDTKLATVLANGNGTLTFNCGGAATITFMSEKSITAAITIDGGGNITLSGGNTTRLFAAVGGATLNLVNITLQNGFNGTLGGGAILNNGTLSLDGVTIRDSNVDSGYSGGAILSYGPVTIANSLIENNTGGSVGGLFALGEVANANITDSTFRNNRTTNADYGLGGAITLWDGADLTLTDSILEQNQGEIGGAIYNQATTSSTFIGGSILRMNTANQYGGAVAVFNGMLSIDDTVIADNTANEVGGGIANYGYTEIYNSTISGNNGGSAGGGVYSLDIGTPQSGTFIQSSTINNNTSDYGGGISVAYSSYLRIINVTISGNTASYGGGLRTFNGPDDRLYYVTFYDNVGSIEGSSIDNNSSVIAVQDVILQSSSGSNCSGNAITSSGFNLASDASCNLTGAGDLQNTNAMLSPLRDNGGPTLTHLPKLGSPAIDNGQCVIAGDIDQRGFPVPRVAFVTKARWNAHRMIPIAFLST